MKIVVTGYASMDYVVRLDSPARADRTATVLSRPKEWPRLGGSPAYVCAALAAAGAHGATPVSWIGEDAQGVGYRDALRAQGVDVEGLRVRPGRTPTCILAYQPDGGCVCLYDPGLDPPIRLDDAQRALIGAADAVCLTVGPAEATREALALARAEAKVVWAVKADARATPPDLAAALVARADLIVHSQREADFVAAAGASARAVRIETRGAQGVAIYHHGEERHVPVQPLDVEDATGAGDTWLGGFLAAYLASGEDLEQAARAGAASVRALLEGRAASAGPR